MNGSRSDLGGISSKLLSAVGASVISSVGTDSSTCSAELDGSIGELLVGLDELEGFG